VASKRELLKAAMEDVRAGKPRQAVFDSYRAQVDNDKHLSFAISSVADPARIKQGDKLNRILFGLLVFAAVTKGLTAIFVGAGLVMLLLGLVVPVVFAVAVYKYEGQAYPFLMLLALLGAARALIAIGDEGGWVLIDMVLFGAIFWLALQVQRIVFPGLKWFAARRDSQGNYAW
jgi:hypothetical protein